MLLAPSHSQVSPTTRNTLPSGYPTYAAHGSLAERVVHRLPITVAADADDLGFGFGVLLSTKAKYTYGV